MYLFVKKRCLAAAFMIGCALQSCQLVPDNLPVPTPVTEQTATSTVYTIKQGSHYADSNPLKQVTTSQMRFAVTFDSTAIYTTTNPVNQGDINKLYGMSDCGSDHHTNSARIGWRWYNGKLELHAYSYLNKERKSAFISNITLGKTTVCEIKLEAENYVFTVDGNSVTLPRACNGEGVGYQLYPYFGGDEVAPHDIKISIQDMK